MDIAKRTGKRHPDVKRDIKNMLKELGLDVSIFAHIYQDTQNRQQEMYILPKREAMILATGYSVRLRSIIIDRLSELEQEKVMPQLTAMEILSKAVLISKEKIAELEHRVTIQSDENKVLVANNTIMKPKALFADSVAQSKNSILIGQFAKTISTETFTIGQNNMFIWLREHGYLIKGGARRNDPMQKYVDKGWLEKTERTILGPDGTVRIAFTTRVTGKGQVGLAEDFMEHLASKSSCVMPEEIDIIEDTSDWGLFHFGS